MTLQDLFGKRCVVRVKKEDFGVLVFDWDALKGKDVFLNDLFGDCEIPGDFSLLLDRGPKGDIVWKSKTLRPFALYNVQDEDATFTSGEEVPQFDALWLLDVAAPDGTVYAISVDGTALPAKNPKKKSATLSALQLKVAAAPAAAPGKAKGSPLSFDEFRPRIKAGQLDGERQKLMVRLSGDKGGGSSYVSPWAKPPKPPPEGRDPRWIAALGEELTAAMLLARDVSAQSGPSYFAGTLVSFGPEGLPTLLRSIEAAVAQYPQEPLHYGCDAVFQALIAYKSNAGIPAAVTLLEKAKAPETMWAMGPALDYLAGFPSDPRVLPALKELEARLTKSDGRVGSLLKAALRKVAPV